MPESFFDRTALLLGDEGISALSYANVVLFGIGGVGSWCAEALVRTGLGNLTIIDSDCISTSNINRQLIATHSSVGRPKVEVMRERLLDINPALNISTVFSHISADDAQAFPFSDYDVVIDAIDSIPAKCSLLLEATRLSRPKVLSSMGAALKSDPTKIQIANFDKVYGCPLARALRQRMKRQHIWPRHNFKCVFSPELLSNKVSQMPQQTSNGLKIPNGTLVYATATFGLTLAHLAVSHILADANVKISNQ